MTADLLQMLWASFVLLLLLVDVSASAVPADVSVVMLRVTCDAQINAPRQGARCHCCSHCGRPAQGPDPLPHACLHHTNPPLDSLHNTNTIVPSLNRRCPMQPSLRVCSTTQTTSSPTLEDPSVLRQISFSTEKQSLTVSSSDSSRQLLGWPSGPPVAAQHTLQGTSVSGWPLCMCTPHAAPCSLVYHNL